MPSGEPPRRRVSTGKPRSSVGRGNVEGVASGWEGERRRTGARIGGARRARTDDARREVGASSRRTLDAPL